MIVKILNKTATFNAVSYNTKKISEGNGELMFHTNLPVNDNSIPKVSEVKNYLKAVSALNNRVKQPQFHATISCKDREFDKYQLTDLAKEYMKRMGYEEQPYIVVFHNDTKNNHVHIVSTRVDLQGKKISDKFDKLISQKHLQDILSEKYGIDEKKNLQNLLKYNVSSFSQMRTLLEVNEYNLLEKENKYKIYKAGILINDNAEFKTTEIDKDRQKQLQKIFKHYSNYYDGKIKLEGQKWNSPLMEKLKKNLGIELVFHTSKNLKEPYGYTVIDHATKSVFKGSEIYNIKNFKEQTVEFNEKIEENLNREEKQEYIPLSEQENINSEQQQILQEQQIQQNLNNILSTALSAVSQQGSSPGERDNFDDDNQKRKRKPRR